MSKKMFIYFQNLQLNIENLFLKGYLTFSYVYAKKIMFMLIFAQIIGALLLFLFKDKNDFTLISTAIYICICYVKF